MYVYFQSLEGRWRTHKISVQPQKEHRNLTWIMPQLGLIPQPQCYRTEEIITQTLFCPSIHLNLYEPLNEIYIFFQISSCKAREDCFELWQKCGALYVSTCFYLIICHQSMAVLRTLFRFTKCATQSLCHEIQMILGQLFFFVLYSIVQIILFQ